MRSDPVSLVLWATVTARDGGCVAPGLDPECGPCRGRLTVDHVKTELRMGRRAPSDAAHLATVCWHHHLDGWATAHRPLLRDYLREANP